MKYSLERSSCLIFLAITFSSFVTTQFALADGMVIKMGAYSGKWDYLSENHQQAFIRYENGLEKMILSIRMKEASKNAVWIFPVPAEPSRVVIDVVIKLPRFSGEEITEKAKTNIRTVQKFLWATQIYPIPFTGLLEPKYQKFQGVSLGLGPVETGQPGVTVHEHLEKEGITTEILTAKDSQVLYQYLQNKRLKIEQGSIPVLDHYTGKEFTFVVSWISQEGPLTGQRGIFVIFPTEKIYYPLIPTSVYGSETIPATIHVMGFVSPEIFGDIRDYTKVNYFVDFIDTYFIAASHLENFYNDIAGYARYTKIEINAPSKMLTEDLWMKNNVSMKINYAVFITDHPAITGFSLLILCSIIAGALAGMLSFPEARNRAGILAYGLIGISNCFSIIGFMIAIFFAKTKETKVPELQSNARSTRILLTVDFRKFGFILLFSALFLAISVIFVNLLKMALP